MITGRREFIKTAAILPLLSSNILSDATSKNECGMNYKRSNWKIEIVFDGNTEIRLSRDHSDKSETRIERYVWRNTEFPANIVDLQQLYKIVHSDIDSWTPPVNVCWNDRQGFKLIYIKINAPLKEWTLKGCNFQFEPIHLGNK